MPDLNQLRRFAREIFDYALASVDPRKAVLRAIVDRGSYVDVCGERVDVASSRPIFAVAIGKAAMTMALGLEGAIGNKLTRGVISAPASSEALSEKWERFNGGHPLPNVPSIAVGRDADEHRASLTIDGICRPTSAERRLPRARV